MQTLRIHYKMIFTKHKQLIKRHVMIIVKLRKLSSNKKKQCERSHIYTFRSRDEGTSCFIQRNQTCSHSHTFLSISLKNTNKIGKILTWFRC